MNDIAAPEINIDELMQRIRDELSGRSAQAAAAPQIHHAPPSVNKLSDRSSPASPTVIRPDVNLPGPVRLWLPPVEHAAEYTALRPKGNANHHVNELLCYDDAAFVEAAYEAVLRRKVDSGGLRCYLAMLREGASKIEVLGRLCESPEGRARNARLDGLALPYLLDSISRWPVVGPLFRIAAAVWNLPSSERKYRRLANDLARQIARMAQHFGQTTEGIYDALGTLRDSQNLLVQSSSSFANRDQVTVLQEALTRAVASIETLKITVANKIDPVQLDAETLAIRRHLDTKAEKVALSAVEQKFQSALRVKADRRDLDLKATDLGAAIRNTQGDIVALEDAYQVLQRDMEAKIERQELTTLTNHLQALLQQRATTDDLQRVAQSVEGANHSISSLRNSKADITAVAALRTDIRSELAIALDDVGRRIQVSVDSKEGPAAFAALNAEVQSALQQAGAEAENALREAVAGITQSLKRLEAGLKLKMDREAITVLEAAGRESLGAAISKVIGAMKSLADTMVDAAQLTAVKDESARAIEQTREEWKDALSRALAPLSSQTRDLKHNVLDQERRIRILLEEARKRLPKPISTVQIDAMVAEEDHLLDAMYASFEDQFRGTRADIRNRVSVYLPYMLEVTAGTPKAPVLDLGCGRGEWLELLKDEGLNARGVDLNRVFVKGCHDLSLDVVEEDALVFLRQFKPNSVGAVTSFHLIEHLPHRYLIAVVDEALRVLRPGGIVIFETPNPRNLRVGACNFYLDPTHRNPLPPDLSRYILEARGFVRVEIRELNPLASDSYVAKGDPMTKDLLNQMFFSAQDYAVIGKKA